MSSTTLDNCSPTARKPLTYRTPVVGRSHRPLVRGGTSQHDRLEWSAAEARYGCVACGVAVGPLITGASTASALVAGLQLNGSSRSVRGSVYVESRPW